MSLEKKILEEVKRYNNINRYIFEQDATADPIDDFTGADTGVNLPAPDVDTPPADTGAEEISEPIDPAAPVTIITLLDNSCKIFYHS